MVLEVDGLRSKVHLSLCNSIWDFVISFLQVPHKTIKVLLDFFIVSSLLCLDFFLGHIRLKICWYMPEKCTNWKAVRKIFSRMKIFWRSKWTSLINIWQKLVTNDYLIQLILILWKLIVWKKSLVWKIFQLTKQSST